MRQLRLFLIPFLGLLLWSWSSFQSPTSSAMIASWNQFKRALKDQDVERTASFFEFPFFDETNHIWLLAKKFPKEQNEYQSDEAIPFNLLDLRENYEGVFPTQFRHFVTQVNAYELVKLDTVHLEPITNGDTIYHFKASLSISASQIQLFYKRNYPAGGEEVIYEMNMSPDERLKFMSIQVSQ